MNRDTTMFDFPNLGTVATWMASFTASVAAVGVFWKTILSPTYRFTKDIAEVLGGIRAIKHELLPNGGGSLRDAVDRIEARIILTEQRARLLSTDSPLGVFETNLAGQYIHVNRTLTRWTGRAKEEMLGSGWLNAISPKCRNTMFLEWEQAIEQAREFNHDYFMRNAEGEEFIVHCAAFPMFDSRNNLAGWMGVITRPPENTRSTTCNSNP